MTQAPYQPDQSKPDYQPSKATPPNPADPVAPKGRDKQGNPIK